MSSRESASAIVFSEPGRWTQWIVNWRRASIKNRHRRRCIISALRLDRHASADTTAWLSQRHVTSSPRHLVPQTAAANTTGRSSLTAIEVELELASHGNWNQWVSQRAPHPHEPDASVARFIRRPSSVLLRGKKPMPFHSTINVRHQAISDLNPRLSECSGVVSWRMCLSTLLISHIEKLAVKRITRYSVIA